MESFYNKYHMLNEQYKNVEEISENTLLFQAEYILLLKERGINCKETLNIFKDYLAICKRGVGLYDQLPVRSGGRDDSMSHDQLTAIMRISKEFDLGIHKEIWAEIKRQHFKYDNLNPDKFWTMDGWHHPMHIMYYGYISGSFIWKTTYPLLLLLSLFTCSAPAESTSGKLIDWVKFKGIIPSIHKVDSWLVGLRNGSWKNVFNFYFKDPNHPINKILSKDRL